MKSMGEVPANPGGRVEERGESCWLIHYKQVNSGVVSTLTLPSSSPLWFALLLTCCFQGGGAWSRGTLASHVRSYTPSTDMPRELEHLSIHKHLHTAHLLSGPLFHGHLR